jgi:hypothetical protein
MKMLNELTNAERLELGVLRVRDAAYNAIYGLWKERQAEGLTQKDIADFLDKDQGTVSRTLAGPGNWTLKSIGELAEAMDGIVFIEVIAAEKYVSGDNYDVYADWESSCSKMEVVPAAISTKGASMIVSVPTSSLQFYPIELK